MFLSHKLLHFFANRRCEQLTFLGYVVYYKVRLGLVETEDSSISHKAISRRH